MKASSRLMAPTSGHERYEFLDVLRGFALFGIITANMILYSLYLHLPESAKASLSTYSMDTVLDFLELVLIEGKFYSIFSVLFGIGFSILLTRAQAKGLVFHRFFLKRVFFLYLIGAGHAVLFWHDDILQFYALCGALLLPVYLLQIWVSRRWLDRYQLGPLEWTWRMLTYGSWVPLTKRTTV